MRTGILACGTKLQTTLSGRRWLRRARGVTREGEDQNPADARDETDHAKDEAADREPSPTDGSIARAYSASRDEAHHRRGRPEHHAKHAADERQDANDQRSDGEPVGAPARVLHSAARHVASAGWWRWRHVAAASWGWRRRRAVPTTTGWRGRRSVAAARWRRWRRWRRRVAATWWRRGWRGATAWGRRWRWRRATAWGRRWRWRGATARGRRWRRRGRRPSCGR